MPTKERRLAELSRMNRPISFMVKKQYGELQYVKLRSGFTVKRTHSGEFIVTGRCYLREAEFSIEKYGRVKHINRKEDFRIRSYRIDRIIPRTIEFSSVHF